MNNTYPTYETLITNTKDEDRLLETKRSLMSIFPRLILFLFSAALVFLSSFWLTGSTVHFLYRILALIPVLIALDIARVYYNDLYVLSRFKITRITGRLSFKYSVPSVNYSDIRGIVVAQGVLGRLLNYGTVFLGTAAYEAHELVLEGVESPNEFAELIEEFRRRSQGSSGLKSAEND